MWLHSSVGRATHRQRGGHGFESRWSPDFLSLLLSNCLNWKIYCDDHSSLSSTTAVQKWNISYILHINIINGLQKLHCNSLTCIPATEKRLDFVQRGVIREMPPHSYETPRKRKPLDKISLIIRGLGWDNFYYYALTRDKYTMENCNLELNSSWDRTPSGK